MHYAGSDQTKEAGELMKTLILTIAVLCCITPLIAEAQTGPAEVVSAARAGLHSFLARIPAGDRQEYGFTETDSLDKAHLGDPFNLNTIAPDALLNYSEGVPVSSILTVTDMWYFPVMIQNEIRCVLVVDYMDGKWQAVSLGYADLAKSLNQVRRNWPAENGYNPVLIAVFQAKKHLVMVPESPEGEGLSILSPTQTAQTGQAGLTVQNAANVLESLKPTVREALKQR
jgi:hypothetical protein